MNLRQIISLSALMVILAVGNSCTRKNPKTELSSPTSGEVLLYADESLSPVVIPLLQVFNGIYTYATVRCEYHPETDVLNALLKSRTPMVFATRPLKTEEKDYFISKKLLVREYLFALDAITLIVNPSVTDSLISVGQIRDILSGKTRTWTQLGFTATTDSIHVVFDNIGSGTVRFMLDTVCQGHQFGPGMNALKNNQEVIDYVSRNSGSMGIIGVSWISSSRDSASLNHLEKLKVLRISRTTPAVPENSFLPYQAFIKDLSYPLARRLYMINLEPRNGLATGFASFVCSDRGQRIILKTGIMPLHEPIRNVKITD
jgi:phosphate transport system substrate-binding protein